MKPVVTRNYLRLSAFAFGLCALASLWIAAAASSSALRSGCGADSGCGQVTSSSWAFIGPVPVSWLGVGVYGLECLALLAALAQPAWHAPIKRLLAFLIGTNLAAAIYFTAAQVWGVGSWCPWCCTIHALALLGSAFAYSAFFTDRSRGTRSPGPSLPRPGRILVGTVGQLILLIGLSNTLAQSPAAPVTQPVPAPEMAADEPTLVSLHGGKFRFDLREVPLLGGPEAGHLIFAITDPTCGHCRQTMQFLDKALEALPEKTLAVVCLPGTREPNVGTALQTLLLTLWREKPAEWTRVVQEIDTGSIAPDLETLRGTAAAALGGEEALTTALARHQAWSSELIGETQSLMVENARLAGREPTLPQLQSGGHLLFGAPTSTVDLDHLTAGAISWPETLMEVASTAASTIPPNPCANRRFCQRVVIILTGDGKDKLVPGPLKLDRFGHSALDDAKILSKSGPNENPPLVYVFSGYQELTQAVRGLKSERIKLDDSTHDEWGRFLRELPGDLEPLLKNTRCAQMLEARLAASASPEKKLDALSEFLSVEVSVYGHSVSLTRSYMDPPQNHGLGFAPPNTETAGGIDGDAFDRRDFEPLKKLLPQAVFRGITQACNGTEVIKFLEPSTEAECACFVSGSGATTIAVSWRNKSPVGLYLEKATPSGSIGRPNLRGFYRIVDALYDPYVAQISADEPSAFSPTGIGSNNLSNREYGDLDYVDSAYALHDTINYMSLPVNPLSGLVKSSADLTAENALGLVMKSADPDSEFANTLLGVGSVTQIQEYLGEIQDSRDSALLAESLERASDKSERFISPVSYVEATKGKEYTEYGSWRLTRLFSPDMNLSILTAAEKAFVESVKEAEAHFATSKDGPIVSINTKKFFELFDPNSENYFGQIKSFGPKTDAKLRVYWSRMDSMRQTLHAFFTHEYRSGKIEAENYNELIKSLQESMEDLNGAIQGYVAVRAPELKKDAFIVNEVKVMMALHLLEKRVRQAAKGERELNPGELEAYTRLAAHVECLEAYGYGPDTFKPDGGTLYNPTVAPLSP
ncbi:MAG: vitamin K epoxide reductase family protein [Verrucomicrobiales bacterium]|nr:vitamin K epoxide reductase family protein [Verrucomicrobiales bacterium]